MFVKLKRDLVTIYFAILFIKHYRKKYYASSIQIISKIELLESNISGVISFILNKFTRTKYHPAECDPNDPYIIGVKERFSKKDQANFLANNILVIKPYLSSQEKGVIIINYTEIINAIPFLFDINKIQEFYHVVLEPSWESPYQIYYRFYSNKSLVFVESLSKREIDMDNKQGFIAVPISAGDWVSENKFDKINNLDLEYDFCAIAHFTPFKRHEFLLKSISKYWHGDLRFCLIASSWVGYGKTNWINELIKKNNLSKNVDIFMDISQEKINELLNKSKCHVLCSKREGANRANFESMFVGTPVVVCKNHIGFPNFRFSAPLVVNFTSSKDLVTAIKSCANIDRNDVYNKAQKLIGSKRATEQLNEYIKKESLKINNKWSVDIFRKINVVHFFYYTPDDINFCIDDYRKLEDFVYDKKHYNSEYAICLFK